MRPAALTIAGSDPSGGAGVQADLKTFHQHGVYGAAAISLVTVQNSRGCSAVELLPSATVRAQVEAVLDDMDVAAVKTGALGSAATVTGVAAALAGRGVALVVDPVRLSSEGSERTLLADDARGALLTELLPAATLVTPNLAEAEWLLDARVETSDDARAAAAALAGRAGCAVLVKGGHLSGAPVDFLAWPAAEDGSVSELSGVRVATEAGHGTGCALASAIAARLALGRPLEEAIIGAKAWIERALASAPPRGQGKAPLDLFAEPG